MILILYLKRLSFILIIIISVFEIGCSNDKKNNEEIVSTDKEFVQSKFPKIEEIQFVKFNYSVISVRGVGPNPAKFSGIIKIGDNFIKKILKDYTWKKCEIQPFNTLFMVNNEYKFYYSDDFREEGKYVTHSFVGKYYLDKEKGVIYFDGEY